MSIEMAGQTRKTVQSITQDYDHVFRLVDVNWKPSSGFLVNKKRSMDALWIVTFFIHFLTAIDSILYNLLLHFNSSGTGSDRDWYSGIGFIDHFYFLFKLWHCMWFITVLFYCYFESFIDCPNRELYLSNKFFCFFTNPHHRLRN